MRWLDGISDSMAMSLIKPQETVSISTWKLGLLHPWGRKESHTAE